jgi:hypothetical protein
MNHFQTIEQFERYLTAMHIYFTDLCSHETPDNVTDQYKKHALMTLAAKAKELKLLITTDFTDLN